MLSSTDNVRSMVVELQRLKHAILKCREKEDLLGKIDTAIELIYTSVEFTDTPFVGFNTHSKVRQLKELRAATLEVDEEQLKEYCQDISIFLGSLQFELWQGQNEELISLIEDVRE